jgi:3D-(3,5/4)-trihydroxycyclohexane-1,2-dione acylhydrolase (decyclizing)
VHYSEAWDELQKFAEAFGIPVSETYAGKGAMRSVSALALGGQGVEGTGATTAIASQADVVICIGTRLTDFTTGSQSAFNQSRVRFISINVSNHDAYKQGALPITADAREALRALHQAAANGGMRPRTAYLQEIATAKKTWAETLDREVSRHHEGEALSQGELIQVLNQAAQPGDTTVAAAGSPPGDLLKLWDATGGRACHLEFGYSCMGYELPASLGVRMAQPEGEVYVLIGDGTYLMNPTELVTAVQENLKVTVVISENHGYQCIRRLQMGRAGRSFGNEFRARDPKTNRLEGEYVAIDFAQNAASFGARTWQARTKEELRHALQEARGEKRVSVIVVETEKFRFLPPSGVWWDVAVAEASNDSVTQKLRAEYESDRARLQRFHY